MTGDVPDAAVQVAADAIPIGSTYARRVVAALAREYAFVPHAEFAALRAENDRLWAVVADIHDQVESADLVESETLDVGPVRAALLARPGELAALRAVAEAVVRAAAVDGDTAGVTTRVAIRQMRDTLAALTAPTAPAPTAAADPPGSTSGL